MPRFSVIIPTYNRVKYIAATLASVQAQEFTDFEVIVVDDGSTDGTLEILDAHKSWLTVLQQKNAGPGVARNVGSKHAKGEYLAFLDSDDIWFPWTLSTFNEVLEKHKKPELVSTKLQLFWAEKDLEGVNREPLRVDIFNDYYEASHKSYFVGACMMTVRNALFEAVGGFTEKQIYCEDSDLALRFGLGRGFVQILAPVTMGYRQHLTNATRNYEKIYNGLLFLIESEIMGLYPGGRSRRIDRLRLLTMHIRAHSVDCLRRGAQRSGWSLYRKSLAWQLRIGRWKYLCGFPAVALGQAIGTLSWRRYRRQNVR